MPSLMTCPSMVWPVVVSPAMILLAFAITPLALFLLDFPLDSVFGLSALALLILVAHRKNIPDEIGRITMGRKLKSDKRAVPK